MKTPLLYIDSLSITIKAIRSLPKGFTILGVSDGVNDAHGNPHRAVLIELKDKDIKNIRRAWFNTTTGEYLGEAW